MTLLFLTVALILGLTLTRGSLFFTIPASIVYLLFLLYRIGKKKTCIAFGLFAVGLGVSFISIRANVSSGVYTGIVTDARENYYLFECRFEKFYVYDRENDKECGDILSLTGYPEAVSFTTYESQFDFNEYLKNKGVSRSLTVTKTEYKFKNPLRINKRKKSFLSNFDDDTASLIDSFLFNHKDYESTPIMLADSLNILSVLSMNGVYLYAIMTGLEYVLKYIFKEKTASLLSTLFLLPYALFSFTKFGVIRVLLMRILSYVNKHHLQSRFNHVTLLSSEMIMFLCADYHLIYQQAFYLGFLISFMLILIRRYSKKVKKIYMTGIIVLSITALMIPINVSSDYEIHLLGPVFQLILLPVHQAYVIISLLSFYTFPLPHVLNGFTRLILIFYKDLSYIDLSIACGEIPKILQYVFYAGLALGLYLYESRRKVHLAIDSSILITILLISIVPIRAYLTNAVYFINVGQGDSILIQNRSHAVMIDTGGNKSFDMAEETLIPFMKKKQIHKLDALITTHDDFDHSGAKDSLISNFKVDTYISSVTQFPYRTGDLYFENLNTMTATEENDQSLVLTLDFMDKKWLFTGDASTTVEKFLIDENLDLNCDILKVGHHGSKTSTSEEFLNATTPDVAVISCGANNYYGHPHEEVVERLKKHNIEIRRTDLEGTISFVEFA